MVCKLNLQGTLLLTCVSKGEYWSNLAGQVCHLLQPNCNFVDLSFQFLKRRARCCKFFSCFAPLHISSKVKCHFSRVSRLCFFFSTSTPEGMNLHMVVIFLEPLVAPMSAHVKAGGTVSLSWCRRRGQKDSQCQTG